MIEVVLDACVIIKWFHSKNEANVPAAQRLLAAVRSGTLTVFTPRLLFLELLNIAAKRWGFGRTKLIELAHRIEALPLDIREPSLGAIAEWISRGLTAYDASYVALAENERLPLVTDDRQILRIAPTIAKSLASI